MTEIPDNFTQPSDAILEITDQITRNILESGLPIPSDVDIQEMFIKQILVSGTELPSDEIISQQVYFIRLTLIHSTSKFAETVQKMDPEMARIVDAADGLDNAAKKLAKHRENREEENQMLDRIFGDNSINLEE